MRLTLRLFCRIKICNLMRSHQTFRTSLISHFQIKYEFGISFKRAIWENMAMTKHHAEPNVNILLTRNISFDSDVIRWSHPLTRPLYCLWANWNNKRLVNLKMTWLGLFFFFDFVCSQARYGCCSILCLRFQVVQIKKVDCKMGTKNVNNYKSNKFCDIFG